MPDHEPTCTGTYTCTRCGVAKPALAFPSNKQKVNGLNSWCRECKSEAKRSTPSYKKQARASARKKQVEAKKGWDLGHVFPFGEG